MLGLSQIFGKEKVAGIDIGSRFIKVVQAEPGNEPGQWRIVKAAVAPTPAESVRDGVVVDIAGIGVVIRDLCRAAGIDAAGAAAAVSGPTVIVRHAKLPRMTDAVLRKSVRYEAGKFISSSVDDSMIAFEITGDVPGEADQMGVMLVAAPTDMVESRLSTLVYAGFEPIAVDIEAFALQRALVDLAVDRYAADETVAVLDIGALTTDVNIITRGRFALTRNIPIAGENFTTALRSISPRAEWPELEAMKAEVDMTVLLKPQEDQDAVNLALSVQPMIDELLREVRRSMNYYQTQLADTSNSNLPPGLAELSEGAPVSRIAITGGSSKLRGLDAYMSARLGAPVEIWNVFDSRVFDISAFDPEFIDENQAFLGPSLGLALKELVEAAPARAKGLSRKVTAKAA